MAQLPLSHIRVVDTSMVYAGPTCGRILAELGADVIKVESLQRPEGTRSDRFIDNDGGARPWNRGGYFMKRNMGKRGITLNLTDSRGQALYKRLVAKSDIVIESYTPRVMRNFGLHYEVLSEINPGLIMISLSGFGQDGPYRDNAAYGMGLEPMSGLSSLTGYEGDAPLRSGMSYTDPLSGTMGALAVLFAVEHRRRTGEGQYIDLSEWEASLPFVGEALLAAQITGDSPGRHGNHRADMAPHNTYPTLGEDRWVTIAVRSEEQWAPFCRVLGRDGWADDPDLANLAGRKRRERELDDVIASWTATRDAWEVTRELQAAGIAAGPVLRPDDIVFDPHLAARGFFEVIDQPEAGVRPFPRQLVARFSGMDAGVSRPAPRLGEHNREVLQELLGVGDEQFAELWGNEVIGDTPILQRPRDPVALEMYLQRDALTAIDPDFRDKIRHHFRIAGERLSDPAGLASETAEPALPEPEPNGEHAR